MSHLVTHLFVYSLFKFFIHSLIIEISAILIATIQVHDTTLHAQYDLN